MLGTIYTEGSLHANYSSGIHRNCSNAQLLVYMYAVHPRTIGCRVRSKIPGMSPMVPAATVFLATRSSSVSTTVSYTRSPDLACLDFFLWGHMKQLVYETIVESQEDLVTRINVAVGTVADMPGISERTRESMV